jgi:hypothetical protein
VDVRALLDAGGDLESGLRDAPKKGRGLLAFDIGVGC